MKRTSLNPGDTIVVSSPEDPDKVHGTYMAVESPGNTCRGCYFFRNLGEDGTCPEVAGSQCSNIIYKLVAIEEDVNTSKSLEAVMLA